MSSKPVIALSMIVKNEAHVLARCLTSLRPLIDRYVICDTGSTDGTQALIKELYADLPGRLLQRPWVDFAHNRNEALQAARVGADYVFVIDADETLHWPDGYRLPPLDADAYALWLCFGTTRYTRSCLLRADAPWRYCGVLHEYLQCDRLARTERLEGPTVVVRAEGARSRNPDKFKEDAALLEAALRAEPQNARYAFYLAQSWRDAGCWPEAREAYARRIAMAGWDEERWYALWQLALLEERMGKDAAQVSAAYLRAYQFRPSRAEPLIDLARFHRLKREFALAHLYAGRACAMPRPDDQLFVDLACYAWRPLDECAVSCWYLGLFDEGAQAMRRLWTEVAVPTTEWPRLQQNLAYYRGQGFLLDLPASPNQTI